MAIEHLDLEMREGRGRSCRNRLRAVGKVPAVVYGRTIGSLAVQMDTKDVTRFLDQHGAGGLVEFSLNRDGESEKYHAIFKEVQYHPYKRELLHVDLQQISLKEEINTHIPLRLVGEAPGIKKGGLVEQHLWQVEVSCLPTQIPEAVELDISSLDLGESFHAKDINLPEGVCLLTDEDVAVVSISLPRREAEETEEAADETVETTVEAPAAEE